MTFVFRSTTEEDHWKYPIDRLMKTNLYRETFKSYGLAIDDEEGIVAGIVYAGSERTGDPGNTHFGVATSKECFWIYVNNQYAFPDIPNNRASYKITFPTIVFDTNFDEADTDKAETIIKKGLTGWFKAKRDHAVMRGKWPEKVVALVEIQLTEHSN